MKMEYKLIELVKKGFILTREPEVVTDELIITFTGAPDGATAIFVEKVHTTQSGDLDNNYPTIGTDSNVTWAGITITDTVTTV